MSEILGISEKAVRNKILKLRLSKRKTKYRKALYSDDQLDVIRGDQASTGLMYKYLVDKYNSTPVVTYYIYESKMNTMDKEFILNVDYTIEEGRVVFSKDYLTKRGSCCGNECDNCPYTKQFKGNTELKET
jgi:hypothetical protein